MGTAPPQRRTGDGTPPPAPAEPAARQRRRSRTRRSRRRKEVRRRRLSGGHPSASRPPGHFSSHDNEKSPANWAAGWRVKGGLPPWVDVSDAELDLQLQVQSP